MARKRAVAIHSFASRERRIGKGVLSELLRIPLWKKCGLRLIGQTRFDRSILISVISVIRGRPTSVSDARELGEPGAVQLTWRS